MARPFTKCVQVNGRIVEGVRKNAKGFYIHNPHKQGQDKREFFTTIERAVAQRDHLSGVLPTIPAMTREQAYQEAIGHGIDPEYLDKHPDVVASFLSERKVNPEYRDKKAALRTLLRLPIEEPTTVAAVATGFTVKQVGKTYLKWYTESRENLDDLKREAKAYNETQEKNEKSGKQTKREKRRKTPRRRTWINFASKRTRQQYRDVDKFFNEFIRIIGNKGVNDLKGSDFTRYADEIKTDARNGRDFKSYCGSRFRNVRAAFNRCKKILPDSFTHPERLGTWLAILEVIEPNENDKTTTVVHATAHKTGRLSPKEKISPAQFRALLKVSCVQWKAIFHLAMNAALKNSDIAAIRWSHLDLESGTMFFPRPKNKRLRQTPLAPETTKALKAWKRKRNASNPDALVFVTPPGGSWIGSTDSLSKHYNDLRDKASVKIPATFQAFRKSPGTVIRSAKIKEWEAAIDMLLGHAPNKSWRNYVGSYPEFLSDAVKVIRRAYFGGKN